MTSASKLMVLVETELDARQQLAKELAVETKRQQQLAELTEEQRNAIAHLVGQEIDKGGRKSVLYSFISGFIFFVLGAGASAFITYLAS